MENKLQCMRIGTTMNTWNRLNADTCPLAESECGYAITPTHAVQIF